MYDFAGLLFPHIRQNIRGRVQDVPKKSCLLPRFLPLYELFTTDLQHSRGDPRDNTDLLDFAFQRFFFFFPFLPRVTPKCSCEPNPERAFLLPPPSRFLGHCFRRSIRNLKKLTEAIARQVCLRCFFFPNTGLLYRP